MQPQHRVRIGRSRQHFHGHGSKAMYRRDPFRSKSTAVVIEILKAFVVLEFSAPIRGPKPLYNHLHTYSSYSVDWVPCAKQSGPTMSHHTKTIQGGSLFRFLGLVSMLFRLHMQQVLTSPRGMLRFDKQIQILTLEPGTALKTQSRMWPTGTALSIDNVATKIGRNEKDNKEPGSKVTCPMHVWLLSYFGELLVGQLKTSEAYNPMAQSLLQLFDMTFSFLHCLIDKSPRLQESLRH